MIDLTAPTIFLYGPPATGKSSAARRLATYLKKTAIDLDQMIEQRAGKTIPRIFAEDGEDAFRDAETATLTNICQTRPQAVVALGGGALLRAQNRAMAEATGPIVVIHTPLHILAKRASRRPGSRPLAESTEHLRQLLETRKEHYASFPLSITLRAEGNPQSVVRRIARRLGRFSVPGMGDPYTVTVAPNAYRLLPELIGALPVAPHHILVVADSNTAPLYGQKVLECLGSLPVQLVTIPAGEEHKTFVTITKLWEEMLAHHIERNDLLIALGGGVVGDLTGFASATWLRGVRWLNLPTSLLAMVDAGVGGKTGADLPQGKNLIGAFHPPVAVVCDTTTLSTLPERELRCGYAEAYKHAVIEDASLSELLVAVAKAPSDVDAMTQMICRAILVKIRAIVHDPFEKTGQRAALNLGHTIGHGIEAASHFTIQHGEAVAMGLYAAARLAVSLKSANPELPRQIQQTLEQLGLPVEIPESLDREAILAAMMNDKKRDNNAIRFVLPIALGKVVTGVEVTREQLDAFLKDKDE